MMTDSLGDTNVHIISRVDGSGTERRRRDYLRSSEFVVRTGFLADDILGRARRGMRGEGLVFRHCPLPHPLFGRGMPHGHQHPDARVGRAFADPSRVLCRRPGRPTLSDTTARPSHSRTWGR